ncbi:hypothetical protein [Halovibrio salipaludis]|uniref:hypothetical protein n=1 Tax=Halovibrio salipaludis TaxID=2032626 RepID=UPI00117A6BCB|nr:hypothetical protein [Halovibrio salipaludis]
MPITDRKFVFSLKAIFWSAAAAIATTFVFYAWNFPFELSHEHQRWAEFGDYIGGTLSPILSFLGLLAILLTVVLQSKSLRISQDDLRLTRAELSETAKASSSQAEHFKTKAKIDDCESVIQNIESEFARIKDWAIRCTLGDSVLHLSLEQILAKSHDLDFLARIRPVSDLQGDEINPELREDEIRRLIFLMHFQIKSLKNIPEAQERHKYYQTKYLWVFIAINLTGIIDWDWIGMLEDDYKDYVNNITSQIDSFQNQEANF